MIDAFGVSGANRMPVNKTQEERSSRAFQVIREGVVFELQSEPEGGYTISVPSLPGCISCGSTLEQAIDKMKDAMEGWIAVAEQEGVPLPDRFKDLKIASI